MNHYGMLDKDQKLRWKVLAKEAYSKEDDSGTQLAEQAQTYGPTNFDHFNNRNEKIAMYKRKKEIETQMDMLRDYKDDETRRNFYMMQLNHSIVRTFEQLFLIH